MGTNNSDSAVVDGASTSAETTGAAEPTTQTETQTVSSDPWEQFGQDESGAEEVTTGEEAATGDPAAAEPPKSEEKPGAEEPPASTDTEEEALAELFGEKPAEGEKPEEKPSEDDLDKQDPTAMQAGQRNATAKEYLKRQEKYSQPLKDLRLGTIEPLEALKRLEPVLGPEKVQALRQAAAHDLVDTAPDAAFKRIYAIKKLATDPTWNPQTGEIPSLEDIVKGVAAPTGPDVSNVDLSSLTKDVDTVFPWNWRDESLDENFLDDREKALAVAARALEAKAKETEAAKTTAETQLSELKSSMTSQTQTAEQQVVAEALKTRIDGFRGDIQGKFLPYVLKNTGLAVDANDTPEVAAFKQRRQELYQGSEYERANNLPSRFESFVENESSVKSRVEDVYRRIVDAQLNYVVAEKKGDKDAMAAAQSAAEEERIPLFTLLRDAHNEFKKLYIDPEMELFAGKSPTPRIPTNNPSPARREVVSNQGSAAPTTTKREYRTADELWDGMVAEAREEEALSAAG